MARKETRNVAAERAARTATANAEAITNTWRCYSVGSPWQELSTTAIRSANNAALYGDPIDTGAFHDCLAAVARVQPQLVTDIQLSMQDQTTLTLWSEHKTVYLLDEDLWSSLATTDPSGRIPAEVFTRLPHPNPYVAFAQPFDSIADNGDLLRIEGMWITGKKTVSTGQVLCSTADPAITSLALLFAGYAVDPATNKPIRVATPGFNGATYDLIDTVLSRLSINLQSKTLNDHINESLTRLNLHTSEAPSAGHADMMVPNQTLAALVRTAIIALVYLCSDEADIGPSNTSNRSKKDRATSATPVRVHPVGYRIGAALRAHRAGARNPAGEPTGRTVAPHIRRAHFHTFRAGPGRTEQRVKWLPPIPVNMHGSTDVPTVHTIR